MYSQVFASSPDLFLLDEPTSALDPHNSNKVLRLIKSVKTDFDKTIIMVSHDTRESLSIADNVFLLSQGKIIFSGDKEELERAQQVRGSHLSKFMRGDYE